MTVVMPAAVGLRRASILLRERMLVGLQEQRGRIRFDHFTDDEPDRPQPSPGGLIGSTAVPEP